MVREYERSANVTYPDDLKIASVIAALPATLRLHVQMTLQDDTTFEDLRQRIEMYEQVSQRWMSDGARIEARKAVKEERGQESRMERKARPELGIATTAANQGILLVNVGPPRE